jgi:hypothetical protein
MVNLRWLAEYKGKEYAVTLREKLVRCALVAVALVRQASSVLSPARKTFLSHAGHSPEASTLFPGERAGDPICLSNDA